MKIRSIVFILLVFSLVKGSAQHLYNPSLEGEILMIGPPDGWEICIPSSTPNVQPGKYAVYLPPSDGNTYIGLLTRPDYTWEDMHTVLTLPFAADSCYRFRIDLAFWQNLSFTTVSPVVLKIYGANVICDKSQLLWQSPAISNTDWMTYEFVIHNVGFDITDLIIEAYFVSTYAYWGYVLADNIRINAFPYTSLGPDTSLEVCNDTVFLDAGEGFTDYLWSDGSTSQFLNVTIPGLYWVKVFNEYGCSWTDSINIGQEEYVEMESQMADIVVACINQQVAISADFTGGVGPYSFQWEGFPDTTQTISFIALNTEYYTVTITDECGLTLTDSIKVEVINDLTFNLGADTTLCPGTALVLSPGVPGEYEWQNGSSASSFTVTGPGLYWVIINSDCGEDSDSIMVSYYPSFEIDLGADTAVCFGENVLLEPGSGFISYLWQDGSNAPFYDVTTSGIYSVTVQDLNSCSAEDEIFVDVLEPVSLPEDTVICQGIPLIITANEDFDYLNWSNGSTANSITITGEGTYWLTAGYSMGCESSDTMSVTEALLPVALLGDDREACIGDSVTVTVEPGPYEYFWNGIPGSNKIVISESGPLELCLKNDCGQDCDTIQINIYPLPGVELGSDLLLMPEEQISLDAGSGFVSYLWQNGTQDRFLSVSWENAFENQLYWVEVDDGHCKNSDSIYIEPFSVIVPDVITPNGDSKNDLFLPGENFSGVKEHTMIVFNRWGEKVWESSSFEEGWDGNVNGNPVAEGAYYWVLEVRYGPQNLKKVYKGSLTILR